MFKKKIFFTFLFCGFFPISASAEFQTIGALPTVLYDAPSKKGRALFLYGLDVPVELISSMEGWSKIRDVQGTIGWVEHASLDKKNILQIRVPVAQIRTQPSENAPLLFEAEENVLLKLDEKASSTTTTVTPGWVRVRHQDGEAGYVQISAVFGL